MLEWKKSGDGSFWATAPNGSDYLVSVYHHGTEIIVTGTDPDGDSILFRPVASVEAGKALAEQHCSGSQS